MKKLIKKLFAFLMLLVAALACCAAGGGALYLAVLAFQCGLLGLGFAPSQLAAACVLAFMLAFGWLFRGAKK